MLPACQTQPETGISGELKTSNIRVVDQAEVPQAPSSPNVSMKTCLPGYSAVVPRYRMVFFFKVSRQQNQQPEKSRHNWGSIPRICSVVRSKETISPHCLAACNEFANFGRFAPTCCFICGCNVAIGRGATRGGEEERRFGQPCDVAHRRANRCCSSMRHAAPRHEFWHLSGARLVQRDGRRCESQRRSEACAPESLVDGGRQASPNPANWVRRDSTPLIGALALRWIILDSLW